jgi:hypothetical protein
MKINIETEFNVGDKVLMKWFVGEIEATIVDIEIKCFSYKNEVNYSVDTGGNIYTINAEDKESLRLVK